MDTIYIKNADHTYTTTPEALKAAKWAPIGDHPGYYIASYREIYPNCPADEDILGCYECDGFAPWIGYHTDNLAATDEAGNAVELALDATECLDTEESCYLLDGLEDCDVRNTGSRVASPRCACKPKKRPPEREA